MSTNSKTNFTKDVRPDTKGSQRDVDGDSFLNSNKEISPHGVDNTSQANSYFQVNLSEVLAKDEELLVSLCFEEGALGVSETLDFRQTVEVYEPETLEKSIKSLEVYFATQPSYTLIERIQGQFSGIKIRISEEANKDWMAEWKKGFVAFPLVESYWVVPSWLEAPEEASEVLKIDPGMAFGTGTHETTQLAAQFIFELSTIEKSRESQHSKISKVIDVGAGTGILSILCAKIFSLETLVGTEIDKDAQRVCEENFARNQVQGHVGNENLKPYGKEGFDLVIANIIDGVLISLQNDLMEKVCRGGFLVLTGILNERREYFRENFHWSTQFQVVREIVGKEWSGLLLQKI